MCNYTSTPQYASMAWCSIKGIGTNTVLRLIIQVELPYSLNGLPNDMELDKISG